MKLVLAVLSAAAGLFAQAVQGTVINRVTGAPVDGAAITLAGTPNYTATTDARGAFRIDDVKPGVYTPQISKRGFIPNGAALRQFQVVAGAQPVSLRAEMTPMGKVSGRVLDGDGKAVRGASVEMLSSFGGPMVTTDKDGTFSIEELVPATYTLSARPPKDAKPIERADGERPALVLTYYPGVTQRSGASRITIGAGVELWSQDIKLMSTSIHRFRGVTLDHKGEPLAGVKIQLADASRLTGDADAQAVSGADGSFEFRDIPDGDWRLAAMGQSDGVQLKAFQRIQVTGRDIERFELRFGLPFSIQGTVSLEAADGSPATGKPTAITLAPAVGGSEFIMARPDEGGRFTAQGVYPGLYQVLTMSPGPQFYLASIRLGDRESPDGRVEFFSSGLPLRVTYRSDGGTVRGTVEECGSATVLLVPQDLELRRREYIRNSKCRANGSYEFTAVRPAEYFALALSAADPAFGFMTTDVNQGHLNAAVKVTVRPNQATLADLKVTGAR